MPADGGRTATPALFVVRAEVRADLREDFDKWYEAEHLPDVSAVLGAASARRAWSVGDDPTHWAVYEFEDVELLTSKVPSPELQGLIDEFDRHWPEGVSRTREILPVVQVLPAE